MKYDSIFMCELQHNALNYTGLLF